MEPHVPSDELVAHAGFLRALARGMLADEHLAEDVVQQAFLRALAHPPSERGLLRAWLVRVVRNLAVDTLTRESRRARRERGAARDEAEAAHGRAEVELALQREVADAVAALDEPYRTVVHLRYFRGRAPAAIAQELGVSPKTVESRLTRAHAHLRRRLEHAWREQPERSRAVYLALAPAAPGWSVLGGVLMTKPLVLVALGGAALLGLLFAWNALAPAPRPPVEPAVADVAPAEPGAALAATEAVSARAEVPPAVERDTAEPISAAQPSLAEVELARALERLGPLLDRSLEGRLDPGAILDAALLVAALDAGDPLPELDATGRLLLPIEGLPEGTQAELCVTKPNQRLETVLTLQIRCERPRGQRLEFEGHERDAPSVQVTTWTDDAGELLHFSLLTEVQPGGRAAGVVVDPPQFTHGLSLYTPLADPSAWKLKAIGMRGVEGSEQPDGGRSYRSGDWDVPQVLDGAPWPRVEDMRLLGERLLAMHAAVKRRSGR